MGTSRENFEAGIPGDSLQRVLQYLPPDRAATFFEIRDGTGLSGKALDDALLELEKQGRIKSKKLEDSMYYLKLIDVPAQEWYTIEESASYLRVSRRTMYQLIHDAQLTPYRVGTGGHRRFRRDDLTRLMRKEDSEFIEAMTASADPVLAELWDNQKDAEYDRI